MTFPCSHITSMEGEIKNIIEVWLATIASLCYCYFISSRLPKGKLRLLSLIPVLTLFTYVPFHLSYAFPTAVIAFFITWLANFKLLLFAFGLGPLSSHPLKPLPIFIAFACLPIRNTAISSPTNPPKPKKLPLNLATETLLSSILIAFISEYRDSIHQKILLAIYCCLIFLLVDVLIFISNSVAWMLFRIELEPPSNEPYFSTSLQDFWGKRWNLMVSNTLRQTVYKPVGSLLDPLFGPKWAQRAAFISTFFISGLMHELLLYYVTRVWPTWEMTGFFVLHGFCVAAEVALKALVGGRWQLPRVVATVITLGFVVVTGNWLFFPPAIRNGEDVRVVQEFRYFADYVRMSFNPVTILSKHKDNLLQLNLH